MARTLPTAAAVAAVTGKGSSSSKNRSTASRTRRRKYSGLTEQDDHRQLESNGTNAMGKENEGNHSEEDVYFLSPPPNKNKKNFMSAPKKKNNKLLRTTMQQFRHDHSFYDPMTYFHTTPSSSTDATTVLMTLPPCTPLLEFNSKKEYLDLATTPRVLLDQFEKDITAATAFFECAGGNEGGVEKKIFSVISFLLDDSLSCCAWHGKEVIQIQTYFVTQYFTTFRHYLILWQGIIIKQEQEHRIEDAEEEDSGLTEQDDHCQLESNGTNATGKENEGDNSAEDVHFLSPPPNKNQKNCMSAPKKKKMLRTTTQQFRHDHSFYDPMTYFHTTPSSSTDATTVLMTLPPCTPLLEFNSKKEYLDLATTPRVLLDQFEKDITAATAIL
eukprot:CAMPEP_0201710010 /NCGR_PEP_ID=MMETSP0578-20130828/58020_1 /ASSEMBLY_ACC=CAM_ASM_000663 /TAXON_ID=267565 /ORGANISM="Skeletonema grethea, Strain CCMP 1804" /LENGTH=384 /DNA_ID=CAMNT_0048199015 /DNA_START=50 /DNA_END=1206 /DNA_ORIENTATION=-